MESYYQTLTRINNIQDKIVKIFPQKPVKTTPNPENNEFKNSEFNNLLQKKVQGEKTTLNAFSEGGNKRNLNITFNDIISNAIYSNNRNGKNNLAISRPINTSANNAINTAVSTPGSLPGNLQTGKQTVYDPYIKETSKKYNIPAPLLKSIIKVESNFDPLAISHKGAQGLMQIMPQTARELELENPFQPLNNIDKGAKYFSNLLGKFNGDLVKALAAYNAGENSFKNNNIPNYPETKNYIQKVMDNYLKYSGVTK